jgi:FAD/FMN-containing dehydrogenase
MEMAQMNQLFAALLNQIRGEVRFDPVTCALYSTDASIYQIKPLGVVLPKTRDDIITTVQLCAEHDVPLIARGGGTSQTGSCLGRGIVLDCSKYLRGVSEINAAESSARVEPGVVPDELNAKLRPLGLMFPVDISPSNRANIGGMCATNAGGSRSIRYGIMKENVLTMDVVLADGSVITASAQSPEQLESKLEQEGLEGNAYRAVTRLAADHRAAIAERFPKIQRRVGGYNLDAFVSPNPFNLKNMLIGSEGTLAVTSSVPSTRVLGFCIITAFPRRLNLPVKFCCFAQMPSSSSTSISWTSLAHSANWVAGCTLCRTIRARY